VDSIDYEKLYILQDKVMDIVFETEDIFYLTGGTCLSRFHQEKRYSDNLDFFAQGDSRFKLAIKNITKALKEQFIVKLDTQSKDFIRLIIDDFLQVDFINDRVYRYGKSIICKDNYQIDNIKNILSNKLNAVIDRDEEKDVFDIYLICKFYNFHWNDILEISHKKAFFALEDLVIRLKTFPVELLKTINIIDKEFLKNFEKEFNTIIDEINQKKEHKL
jgi:hypothetical protein